MSEWVRERERQRERSERKRNRPRERKHLPNTVRESYHLKDRTTIKVVMITDGQ